MESASRIHPGKIDTLHLVVVQVKHLGELERSLERVRSWGIDCHPFYESDIDNELTSFATAVVPAEQRRQFKRFQLWRHSIPGVGAAVPSSVLGEPS